MKARRLLPLVLALALVPRGMSVAPTDGVALTNVMPRTVGAMRRANPDSAGRGAGQKTAVSSVLVGASGPLKMATVMQCVKEENARGARSHLEPREGSGGWQQRGPQKGKDAVEEPPDRLPGRAHYIAPLHTKELCYSRLRPTATIALPEGFKAELGKVAREAARRAAGDPAKLIILLQGEDASSLASHVWQRAEDELLRELPRSSHAPELQVLPLASGNTRSALGRLGALFQSKESELRVTISGLAMPTLRDDLSTRRIFSHVTNAHSSARRGQKHHTATAKNVRNFSTGADSHIRRTFGKFCRRTMKQAGQAERRLLKDSVAALLVADSRRTLYKEMMWLERQTRTQLRDRLVFLLEKGLTDDQQIARATNQVQKRFIRNCRRLTPKLIGDDRFGLNQLASECCSGLESFATNFVNSPLAHIAIHLGNRNRGFVSKSVLLSLLRTAQRLRVALGFTGMIRRTGTGNLQGYANFDTGPVSLTLGYANDRDAPDAGPSGTKVPLFRIQPRLHFELSK